MRMHAGHPTFCPPRTGSGPYISPLKTSAPPVDARRCAARKIDDPEPGMAERNGGIDKDSAAVRPAMGERPVHRSEHAVHFGAGGGEPGHAAHPSTIGSAQPATPEWQDSARW